MLHRGKAIYRLYDVKTSSVIHSRDVVFNESSRGIESEQEENQLIQVESFPETEAEESEIEEDSDQLEMSKETQPQDDLTEEVTTDAQVPRRTSARETKRPDYYGVRVYTVPELQKEPESVTDALSSSDKEQWKVAMQKEMDSIHSNDVWDLVKLP